MIYFCLGFFAAFTCWIALSAGRGHDEAITVWESSIVGLKVAGLEAGAT